MKNRQLTPQMDSLVKMLAEIMAEQWFKEQKEKLNAKSLPVCQVQHRETNGIIH